jgi:hypothetical protein
MTGSISNKPGERSIEIIVGASLELSGLPVKLEEAFKRENTFRNPQYDTLKRLNKYAGDTPQLVKLWRQSKDGGLILPRGHFSTVIAKLQEQGLTYHVGDVTICPELGQELKLSGKPLPVPRKRPDEPSTLPYRCLRRRDRFRED